VDFWAVASEIAAGRPPGLGGTAGASAGVKAGGDGCGGDLRTLTAGGSGGSAADGTAGTDVAAAAAPAAAGAAAPNVTAGRRLLVAVLWNQLTLTLHGSSLNEPIWANVELL